MNLSPIGRAALKAREGEVLTAYRDSVGIWTIGVGITTASGLIKVTPGLKITKAQSDALFAQAVARYVDPVRKALRSDRSWPQEFFDACVSLAYNIGPVGFAQSSVVRRANAGDMAGAIEAFLMWNKPAVIIPRRQGERDQAATPYSRALPRAPRGSEPGLGVGRLRSGREAGARSLSSGDDRADRSRSPARPLRRAFFCALPGVGRWLARHHSRPAPCGLPRERLIPWQVVSSAVSSAAS